MTLDLLPLIMTVTLLFGHTRATPRQVRATATTIHREIQVEGQVQWHLDASDLQVIRVGKHGVNEKRSRSFDRAHWFTLDGTRWLLAPFMDFDIDANLF
jgi:hypothetical protein